MKIITLDEKFSETNETNEIWSIHHFHGTPESVVGVDSRFTARLSPLLEWTQGFRHAWYRCWSQVKVFGTPIYVVIMTLWFIFLVSVDDLKTWSSIFYYVASWVLFVIVFQNFGNVD